MIPRVDLHIHTTFSDGKCTMPEVVEIAEEKGMEYIAFTDHAFNEDRFGLDESKIDQYIYEANLIKENSPVKILVGLEAEISSIDRAMRYRDRLDLMLLSNHGQVRTTFKSAIISLIENHTIDIIAHPWYINDADWDEVIEVALERDVAIELNNFRKVPKPYIIERMAKRGLRFSIGSDAHFRSEIGRVGWAYEMLEKLGLGAESLIKLP